MIYEREGEVFIRAASIKEEVEEEADGISLMDQVWFAVNVCLSVRGFAKPHSKTGSRLEGLRRVASNERKGEMTKIGREILMT